MPTPLPPNSDFTAATVTEGGFKTAISDMRAFLAGLLGSDGATATALATLGSLGGAYVSRSAATTLTTADRGKVIGATGSWTLSLPAAATAGAGWMFGMRNTGTGTIAIDPNGSETIDGAATLDVMPGHGSLVICDGTGWISVGPSIQANATDTTTGRLMINGGHGLGAATAPALADLDAQAAAMLFSEAGATGSPGGGAPVAGLHLAGGGGSQAAQIAAQVSADKLFWRRKNTNWAAWREIVSRNAAGTIEVAGVSFDAGATVLDSYDLGTWTPVIADASTAGNTASFTLDGANYVKLGRLVTVNFSITNIDTTGMTPANTLFIRGLPFANSSGSLSINASRGGISISNTSYSGNPVLRTTNGTSHLRIVSATSTGGVLSLTVGDLTSATSDIWGSISYLTLD